MEQKEIEFKELEQENSKMRNEIDNIIGLGLNHPSYSPLWLAINELIENEIKQERLCGE